MAEVFTEEYKTIFKLAKKLEILGESESAKKLCQKCVETISFYNGEDVLTLFYGEQIYDKMRSMEDAMNYVFIARCARNAYDVIYSKNPISYEASSWAKRDKYASNKLMRDFFDLVKKPNRTILSSDCKYFRKLLDAMTDSENTYFKVADHLLTYTIIDIIKMLVNGSVTLTSEGELR